MKARGHAILSVNLALLLLLLVISGCGGSSEAPRGLPPLHTEGRFIKDSAGKTVILRGVAVADLMELDTMRAPMTVARLIDLISDASQGWNARVVRLTVYPPDWRPDPDNYFATYLKPAVDHATARGLYAIVDWHEIGDAAPADQETRQFWAQAAPAFAHDPNVLYEVFNESEDLGDLSWATWKANAQPWVDQIRRDAPDNIILIGAPFWTQALGGAITEPFVGENLAYVGHIYPGIDGSVWGPGGVFTQVAAVRPMMITEWGYRAGGIDPVNGDQAGFGEPLKAYLEAQRLGWTAWCADTIWDSTMFDADWNLRVGPGEMGGFTKDWLAEKKDGDPGSGSGGAGGNGGSGGHGGGDGVGGGGGTTSSGVDGGGIDCATYTDADGCASSGACYWRDPDCHSPVAVCAFMGGPAMPCP
jgi:endoglucanase